MFLLLALACSTPEEEPDFDPELAAELDASLDQTFSGLSAPGAAAAVFVPGEEGVYVWTAGTSDAERIEAMRADDVWAVASLTKLFVAHAALQLEEEGRLGLDDPLSTWITGYPTWDAITLRQLLSHTSGIDDLGGSGLFTTTFDETEYLGRFADEPLAFEPGTDVLYSSAGYMLAGQVVGAAAGSSWRQVVRDRVLDPMALDETHAPGDGLGPESTVAGWLQTPDGELLESPMGLQADWAGAAGEMVGTPEDMAVFGHAFFAGDLLSAEQSLAMTTELVIGSQETGFGSYGAELVRSDDGALLVWKDGTAARGQHSRLRWDATTGVAVATFTSLVEEDFHGGTESLQQSAWQAVGVTYTP